MAELPPEIVTNILSRVDDLKTIGRCRCVCKLWSSFSQLPSGLVLLSKNLSKFSEYHMHYFHHDDNGSFEEPLHPTKHLDAAFLVHPSGVGNVAFIAGSANGFVSVVTIPQSMGASGLRENPIYVFNPVTGQIIQLPVVYDIPTGSNSITEQQRRFHPPHPFDMVPRDPFPGLPTWFPRNPSPSRPSGFMHNFFPGIPTGFPCKPFADRPTLGFAQRVFMQTYFPRRPSRFCGFGLDDSRREYKFVLVRIVSGYNEVLVHTLGRAVWRKKSGVVPPCLVRGNEAVSSAFVDGSLHWFTTDEPTPTPTIVSFNLGTEEFGFVQTPDLSGKFEDQRLGLMEKDLSIVDWSDNGEIGIWVMKEYNVRESWVKRFSIEKQLLPCTSVPKLIKLCKDGELLMICDGHNLVGYDTVTRKARSLWSENKAGFRIQVHPLVGSMFSVKRAFGIDQPWSLI